MSFTATLFPIIAALIAPEGDLFPRPNRWFTCNTKQDYFYEHILTKRSELAACSDKELQTWVSFNHEFLNHKAHARGFSSINFTPFSEEEFGILSILDVMVHWKEKAAKTTLHVTRHGATASYAAVSMSRHFTCYAVPSYPHPVP